MKFRDLVVPGWDERSWLQRFSHVARTCGDLHSGAWNAPESRLRTSYRVALLVNAVFLFVAVVRLLA